MTRKKKPQLEDEPDSTKAVFLPGSGHARRSEDEHGD